LTRVVSSKLFCQTQCLSAVARKGIPFPHLQFIAQGVPPASDRSYCLYCPSKHLYSRQCCPDLSIYLCSSARSLVLLSCRPQQT